MNKLFILLIFSLFFSRSLIVIGQVSALDYHYQEIPTSWIEKIKEYDYTSSSNNIIQEFASYIYPDSLESFKYKPFLNPIFVNLDEDENNELLLFIGGEHGYSNPKFCVFKFVREKWFLIYMEDVWLHNQQPELYISNDYSINKVFYIKKLHDYGSGIYREKYHFFKLVNNNVYPCLEIVSKAYITPIWGLFLNQTIESRFQVSSGEGIWVAYDYNFYTKFSNSEQSSKEASDVSFVKGKAGISYYWNKDSLKYIPHFHRGNTLSKEKISCFGDFGNDKLFIEAFYDEIQKLKEEGNEIEKKLLQAYIEKVSTEGQARIFDLKKTKDGKVKGYKIDE